MFIKREGTTFVDQFKSLIQGQANFLAQLGGIQFRLSLDLLVSFAHELHYDGSVEIAIFFPAMLLTIEVPIDFLIELPLILLRL